MIEELNPIIIAVITIDIIYRGLTVHRHHTITFSFDCHNPIISVS
jgi:hypothetical protein